MTTTCQGFKARCQPGECAECDTARYWAGTDQRPGHVALRSESCPCGAGLTLRASCSRPSSHAGLRAVRDVVDAVDQLALDIDAEQSYTARPIRLRSGQWGAVTSGTGAEVGQTAALTIRTAGGRSWCETATCFHVGARREIWARASAAAVDDSEPF